MAQLVVRNLEEDVKRKLQRRARQHGRSMQEEVHDILRNAVEAEDEPRLQLGRRLRGLFAQIGLEEDIPEMRGEPARPADLG